MLSLDFWRDRPFKSASLGGMLGDLRGIFILGRICAIGGKEIMGTGNGYQELRVWNCSFISLLITHLFTLHSSP